jgi:hypothetical protein
MFPPPKVYDEAGKEVTAINGIPQIHKTTKPKEVDKVKPAKLSFIEAETLRFKNIATLVKPIASPGC